MTRVLAIAAKLPPVTLLLPAIIWPDPGTLSRERQDLIFLDSLGYRLCDVERLAAGLALLDQEDRPVPVGSPTPPGRLCHRPRGRQGRGLGRSAWAASDPRARDHTAGQRLLSLRTFRQHEVRPPQGLGDGLRSLPDSLCAAQAGTAPGC
jgi:hypothetical protein